MKHKVKRKNYRLTNEWFPFADKQNIVIPGRGREEEEKD